MQAQIIVGPAGQPVEVRPVKGWEGLYSVSREGLIWRHSRGLTDADIAEIRRRYAEGGVSQEALGREFGVNGSFICMIVNHNCNGNSPGRWLKKRKNGAVQFCRDGQHQDLTVARLVIDAWGPPIRRPVEMRPVAGYNGLYSVTCEGRVFAHRWTDYAGGVARNHQAKWLHPHPIGDYLGIVLYNGSGTTTTHYIHRLVLEAWGPPQPSQQHWCNHIDLDKRHNHISNLEWLTPRENVQHAIAHGRGNQPGSANVNAILSEAEVLDMRARFTGKRGECAALGREFGLDMRHVWAIVHRKCWTHI